MGPHHQHAGDNGQDLNHEHERHPSGLRATLWPSCREMSYRSSRELDTPLTFWQRVGGRLHLLLCRFCRRYRAQLQLLRQIARTRPPENAAGGKLSASAKDRLKAAVLSESKKQEPPEA